VEHLVVQSLLQLKLSLSWIIPSLFIPVNASVYLSAARYGQQLTPSAHPRSNDAITSKLQLITHSCLIHFHPPESQNVSPSGHNARRRPPCEMAAING
jgi:hypothetical protein